MKNKIIFKAFAIVSLLLALVHTIGMWYEKELLYWLITTGFIGSICFFVASFSMNKIAKFIAALSLLINLLIVAVIFIKLPATIYHILSTFYSLFVSSSFLEMLMGYFIAEKYVPELAKFWRYVVFYFLLICTYWAMSFVVALIDPELIDKIKDSLFYASSILVFIGIIGFIGITVKTINRTLIKIK